MIPAQLNVRDKFERNFHKRCQKFAFMKKYYQQLEQPSDRFIVFTYHEEGFKNGGFGDRMGGLVTAFALAIKYDRNLIIRSSNGFSHYFRPHYRGDEDHSNNPRFLWNTSSIWTGYDAHVEANPTSTVYDLEDCCSTSEDGWPNEQVRKCSMDDGDVPHTIIKFRSNRAYLCRWLNETQNAPYNELGSLLGDNLDPYYVDFFEVAGCMLRLVMWPTEALWSDIHSLYHRFENPKAGKKKKRKGKETKSKNKTKKETMEEGASLIPFLNTVDSSLLKDEPFTQIGMHFRCGDRWSFAGFKLHTDGYDRYACILDDENNEEKQQAITSQTSKSKHEKSLYLVGGNPVSMGKCAAAVRTEYVMDHDKEQRKRKRKLLKSSSAAAAAATAAVEVDGHGNLREPRSLLDSTDKPLADNRIVMYATSDNFAASQQIMSSTEYNMTFMSPQGCHIEWDDSFECYALTTKYWFVLALSDTIITQTVGEYHMPTSAFSRFAGIYGLAPDPFRSARHCSEPPTPTFVLAQLPQGNWFCTYDLNYEMRHKRTWRNNDVLDKDYEMSQ